MGNRLLPQQVRALALSRQLGGHHPFKQPARSGDTGSIREWFDSVRLHADAPPGFANPGSEGAGQSFRSTPEPPCDLLILSAYNYTFIYYT